MPIVGSFLVNVHKDPIIIKVCGRASYTNCAPLSSFFKDFIAGGKHRFVIDFSDCVFMDSTFLGIIAGTALSLQKKTNSQISLFGLNKRNRDLVENMGLPQILQVIDSDKQLLDCDHQKLDECTADKNLILQAHRSLVKVNSNNQKEFQDLIKFLDSKTTNL